MNTHMQNAILHSNIRTDTHTQMLTKLKYIQMYAIKLPIEIQQTWCMAYNKLVNKNLIFREWKPVCEKKDKFKSHNKI